MLVIGLTGGIGSGKSEVARLLAAYGAEVIDADLMARRAVEPGTDAHAAIVNRFGVKVLAADRTLDRQKMADVAFHDPAALADLNAITHPAVGALIASRMGEVAASEGGGGTEKVVVLEIPLLTAATRERYPMEAVVVVDAPDELRLSRLVMSRKMNILDARARMAAQIGREERLGLADFVVDNSGDREALAIEVDRAWEWIGTLRGQQPGERPASRTGFS